jgi:hypothetical protein
MMLNSQVLIPRGYTVNPARMRLHAEAVALIGGNPALGYVDAIKAASGEFIVQPGVTVDPGRLALHRAALYRAARQPGTSYLDAVKALSQVPAAQPVSTAPAPAAPTPTAAPVAARPAAAPRAPAAAPTKPATDAGEALKRWIRLQGGSLDGGSFGGDHKAWILTRLAEILTDPASALAAKGQDLAEMIDGLKRRCAAA